MPNRMKSRDKRPERPPMSRLPSGESSSYRLRPVPIIARSRNKFFDLEELLVPLPNPRDSIVAASCEDPISDSSRTGMADLLIISNFFEDFPRSCCASRTR